MYNLHIHINTHIMCYVESLRFYVAMETMGGVAVPR